MAMTSSSPRSTRLSSGGTHSKSSPKFPSWPYGEKPVFVLSTRTLRAGPADGAVVERMAGAPAEVVSRLSARGIRHLYVDGGITIQRFLRAGLIQHLTITRVPVLIGSGIPLFGGDAARYPPEARCDPSVCQRSRPE